MIRFTQLTGNRKVLELSGASAAFGRARVAAVVNDGIELRESEQFTSNSGSPTRQIFGVKYKPWDLHGRFSDYHGGEGFATAKSSEIKQFVAEMQPVRVAWDDILSATGLITSFEPSREAEGEIEWKMTVKIDADEYLERQIDIPQRKRPKDYTNQMLLYSTEISEAAKLMPLRIGLFDIINGFISTLSTVTGTAVALAEELQSFETEAFGSLRRFRASVGQVKTAAFKAREAVDAISVDAAIESRNYKDQFAFSNSQAIISDSAISLIKEAADADRRAEIAQRGQALALYEAKGGDTFESISKQYYGSAQRASDIREANGVAGGQAPVDGQIYLIPV
jgi:nucleoid-associated protein YgaU